ncbi:MAG: exodeoxyribonuclease V subunit gamma, partial [Ruminococcus sp.]|nr:exodeoxyribonuclease V subunit gamma [Ruminococcus sp.]
MLHFIIGGAGCGKSFKVMEFIKSSISNGDDVMAIIPEQFSYEFDKKLYGYLGVQMFNAIETHSFTSLARDIFRRFGNGKDGSYMDELMQIGLILKALNMSKGQLNIFSNQIERGEFVKESASIISILRRCGIDSENFFNKCHNLGGKLLDKLSDIRNIYQNYETLLAKHHLKDILTDITESAAIANGNDYFAGKTIFIDEFESFTPDQYEMLGVIIGLADEVYIAMRMESENEHEFSLFASVGAACRKIKHIAAEQNIKTEFIICNKQHRIKHKCIQKLSQTIFRPQIKTFPDNASHIHIFESVTPSDEVEYVCASIKRLLAENKKLKCSDIAIVTNDLSSYSGMLEHSMKRYALPYHIDMPKALIHTPFMVYLITLASLLTMNTPDTELLLKCGKSGFTDLSLIELSELENYCYIWNIDGNLWNETFTMGIDSKYNEILKTKLLSPLIKLRTLCKDCNTGNDYSIAVYKFLSDQNISEKAAELCSCNDEGKEIQMKQDFKRVWDSLMDILDVLAFLYNDKKCSSHEYFTQFCLLLRTVSHSVPPKTLDAVFIGPARTSRLSEPKITFVLGVCDGIFPMNTTSNSLFSERDRIELSECGIEIGQSPELRAADERLAVYKILSSASEELYLCYHLKDDSDKKSLRSSVIDHTISLFKNKNEILITQNQIGTTYYAVTKAAAYYHYVRDFSKKNNKIAAIQSILYEDNYYANRINYLKTVHNDIDFTVSTDVMENLLGNRLILSASQIETYNICPFEYFCKYALKLFERRRVKFEALQTGNLIHACLELLIKNTNRERFLSMTQTELHNELDRLATMYWEQMLGGNKYQSIRDIAAFEYIKEGLNDLALRLQKEFEQSLFYPEFIEAEISDNSIDFPSEKLLTDSGHIVSIRGKIDRVDVFRSSNGNWVRVVDYKTGGKKFSLGSLAYGLNMQMLLYLFTITGKNSRLSGFHPAGILYMPVGSPECIFERGSILKEDDAIIEQYKMNGILIDDKSIVEAMDKGISGKYVKASLLKNRTSFSKNSGTFLSEKQFEGLRRYTEKKLKETADLIYSGEVAANPLEISQNESCKYCTYKDICG